MARKTSRMTISTKGRDQGKVFVLTEMSASQAEKWAARALLALTNSGAELPDEVEGAGMAGLAMMGLQALQGLKFEVIEPLMDEMFGCIQIAPDAMNPNVLRHLIEDDIEEVVTRIQLRKAVLELHMGFSFPGVQSKAKSETPLQEGGRITRTSPAPLAS